MKKIVFVMIICCLVGCAAFGPLPGNISQQVSGFDKTTEIRMEPAWLIGGSESIKLGLYKSSKMEEDQAVLVVVVLGTYNFSDKGSLQFKIDGAEFTLESIDSVTDIETKEGVYNSVAYIPAYNESSKRYWVNKDFIMKLINAKEVWVKVNLSKNYVEGEFSKDVPYAARPAFKKFYQMVWVN